MRKLKVRLATLEDLDVLVHQRHMMFEDMKHRTEAEHRVQDESYRAWASELIPQGRLRCYLAVAGDGEAVAGGCVWLREVQPGPGHGAGFVPYLLSMYTEPGFRRMGLATMIVKEALERCKKDGYTRATLHASDTGRRVYRQLGWERTWEMDIDL